MWAERPLGGIPSASLERAHAASRVKTPAQRAPPERLRRAQTKPPGHRVPFGLTSSLCRPCPHLFAMPSLSTPATRCTVSTVRIAIISVDISAAHRNWCTVAEFGCQAGGHSESSPHFCWQIDSILPKYAAPQAVKAILSKRAKEQQSVDTERTVQICSFVVSENRSNNSEFEVNSNK